MEPLKNPQVVSKNTFITVVGDPVDDHLNRSQSDPTGGKPKTPTSVAVTEIQGATITEEAGNDEDEDEDDDEAPLARSSPAEDGGSERVKLGLEPLPEVPVTGPIPREVVVRNTFIEFASPNDEDNEPLFRAQTDSTSNRKPGQPNPYMKVTDPVAAAPRLVEFTLTPTSSVEPAYIMPRVEGADDDEDDDESPLVRSVAAVGLPGGGAAGARPLGLDSLLPEGQDETPDALSQGYGAGPDMLGYGGMQWPYMMPQMQMPYPMMPTMSAPALGSGPPFGMNHSFHQECRNMGSIDANFRMFSKKGYEGRLSLVTESRIHTASEGVQRYLIQFLAGELSPADGVGFVFSDRLPCAKNIQKIVSIFANAHGRICLRVYDELIKVTGNSSYIKPLEIGDWVEMSIDLDKKVATFNIWPMQVAHWPQMTGKPLSTAEVPFGEKMSKRARDDKPVNLSHGHLACVVKNQDVTLLLGS